MAPYELLGGSPHDFVFNLGASPRPGISAHERLILRAKPEASRSLGSLALEVKRGVVLDLAIDEQEFGELDDESGALRERLAALTARQVVVGSPLGIRAAHQSTTGLAAKLGLAAGYRNRSRLRNNQLWEIDSSAKSIFIPKARPLENPVPIADLELGDGSVRPLFNCMRDPAYIRDQSGVLHAIRRAPSPIRFSLFKKRLGKGQFNIPVNAGYVQGINLGQLEDVPANALLLVYSDMLNWLDIYAPSIAHRAVCGGSTERPKAGGSQLPIMQRLLRYDRKTVRRAHRVGL